MKKNNIYSAIDLGTNACRLTIASDNNGRVRIIETFSRVIQFGENLHTTGVLSQKAMERGIKALSECAKKLQHYNIDKSLYVATEACRQAKNAEEFLRKVETETGLNIKIISAKDEIYFATIACTDIMHSRYPYGIVFDIGGGSTEISWFEYNPLNKSATIIDYVSIPYGFITIADPDDIKSKEIKRQEIRKYIMEFANKNDIFKHISMCKVQIIGVSGTVNSLVNILLQNDVYYGQLVNGFILRVEDLNKILHEIQSMDLSLYISRMPIQKQQYLIDSSIILGEIYDAFPFPIMAADTGVRTGIIKYLSSLDN